MFTLKEGKILAKIERSSKQRTWESEWISFKISSIIWLSLFNYFSV